MQESIKMLICSPDCVVRLFEWGAGTSIEKAKRMMKKRLDHAVWNSDSPAGLQAVVLFKQDVVLYDFIHLIPIFLKFSPLMVSSDNTDFSKGYILIKEKRKTKVFSLITGEFCGLDVFGEQEQFSIMSTNHNLIANEAESWLSHEALEILDTTRPVWEGKLRIVYTSRNTIREYQSPDKKFSATDDEMKIEATYRLHLLGLSNAGELFLRYGYLFGSEQLLVRESNTNDTHTELSLVDDGENYFYKLGWRHGYNYSRSNKDCIDYTEFPPTAPTLLRQGDRIWALISFDSDKIEARIKEVEQENGILVYYARSRWFESISHHQEKPRSFNDYWVFRLQHALPHTAQLYPKILVINVLWGTIWGTKKRSSTTWLRSVSICSTTARHPHQRRHP